MERYVSKTKWNSLSSGCVDVFKAFLVNNSLFCGLYEFPILKCSNKIPEKLMAFSQFMLRKNEDCWVHFYENDYSFERVWNNPRKYLSALKKAKGVILPDFSLYFDMPLSMQIWNIYRSRALGFWLQQNGVEIIPNIRFSDERTFLCCCDGIPRNSTISYGSYGMIKNVENREMFEKGFAETINFIKPKNVIVYGKMTDQMIKILRSKKIEYKEFGQTSLVMRGINNG